MPKSEKLISDERKTASSYVINFYNEIQLLTHHAAQYYNMLSEITYIYGKHVENMNEDHKALFSKILQEARYYVHKSYTFYECISENVLTSTDKKIKKLYQSLSENYVMSKEELKEYVKALNNVLITDVMKGLLQSSSDLINDLYGE